MNKNLEIFKIVIIYALFGCLWIYFSDSVLSWLVRNAEVMTRISIFKGLLFVGITSLLLYFLIARLSVKLNRSILALRESEERFQFLVKNSSDSLVILNADGSQRYASPGAEKISGYPITELVGRTLDTLIHPDDMEDITAAWNWAVEHPDQTVTVQYRHIHKERGWVHCEAIAQSFLDVPAINGIIASVRDITERKEAEKRVSESYELLRNLARLVPGVIYQYRLYPDGRSAFPYASPGMNDIYEVTPEAVQTDATPVFSRLHPEDHDRVAELIMESARTLDMFYCEFRVILPRQGLGWRWCQAQPQRLPDGSTLWHGIIVDISERKKAEQETEKLHEQLTQAQKMESIGRLAGGVAHDFNNMLGVILGYAEMALERISEDDPIQPALLEIQDAAKRSADLTRQLLGFARKQTMSPKIIDVNETVESMLNMLQRLIGEDIDLNWLPDRDLDPVKMDPSQIDQILANLCVNARDAITDTGKVTIETGNVIVDESYRHDHAEFECGAYVMIAVSDNGCGMDRETLSHLFEPFFTTKKTGAGTGLGLAMVYGIVKQNNGFINVYSEPGQGTTFKIFLPQHAEGTRPTPQDRAPEATGSGHETILLVEDEPMILDMTTLMLRGLGYQILPAATPGEAIRLAQEYNGEISLLMTDVVMPEMNGRDLAENLLQRYPNLRRLFMSGYTANVIAHHGVLDEGVHFIQKPFSTATLAAKVREALG